mmetsp:Transcript_87354/g.250339  ORF Transcript_87354/g.250339 Transcript_87354/m.250339 type:complete len:310 (-) Transcript_87354:162-1091(-)
MSWRVGGLASSPSRISRGTRPWLPRLGGPGAKTRTNPGQRSNRSPASASQAALRASSTAPASASRPASASPATSSGGVVASAGSSRTCPLTTRGPASTTATCSCTRRMSSGPGRSSQGWLSTSSCTLTRVAWARRSADPWARVAVVARPPERAAEASLAAPPWPPWAKDTSGPPAGRAEGGAPRRGRRPRRRRTATLRLGFCRRRAFGPSRLCGSLPVPRRRRPGLPAARSPSPPPKRKRRPRAPLQRRRRQKRRRTTTSRLWASSSTARKTKMPTTSASPLTVRKQTHLPPTAVPLRRRSPASMSGPC